MKENKGKKGNFLRIRMWFGGYKQACLVGTILSLIRNMFKGVRQVSLLPLRKRVPSAPQQRVGCGSFSFSASIKLIITSLLLSRE